MDYKDIIVSIIVQATLSALGREKEPARSLLTPPRRRQYDLLDKVGILYLPFDSIKVLQTLAGSMKTKPITLAETLLQAILNSVPIVEGLGENIINTEQLTKMIEDSIIINKIHD